MFAPPIHPPTLARWLEMSRTPEIDAAIRAVHTSIAERVAEARPVCTASARCCDFARTGHDLFVTGLEAAWTLDRIPADRAIGGDGVRDARARGDCPFLARAGGLSACGVHPARPAGCRVYFCDPTRTGFVEQLAEYAAREIRAVHDRFGVPYVYAEWRHLLGAFLDAGEAVAPTRPLPAPPDPVSGVMLVLISHGA